MAAFELGIITDEVTGDFERSCELIRSWGLTHIELRMIWGKNVLQLSEAELEQAQRIVAENGFQVTAIASPVFKSPLDGKPRVMEADFALAGSESLEEQLALLERAADLCERFGTRFIRVFTFWREPWSDELASDVGSKLARAAEVARARNVVLAVENEPVCTVGTGQELGELWDHLSSTLPQELLAHLTMLWDPGNARAAGERAYPDGYQALRGHDLGHVHLKDVRRGGDGKPEFLPLGRGDVDYPGQLRALVRDGYEGVLVLECHYRPAGMSQAEATHDCVTAAQKMLAEVERG